MKEEQAKHEEQEPVSKDSEKGVATINNEGLIIIEEK